MTQIAKRSFLAGLASLLSAPAIVRAGNIMPVKRPALVVPKAVLRLSGLIEAERRAQADLREILDYTNNKPGGFEIYGHVQIGGLNERDTG